jgi:hypothetical protein
MCITLKASKNKNSTYILKYAPELTSTIYSHTEQITGRGAKRQRPEVSYRRYLVTLSSKKVIGQRMTVGKSSNCQYRPRIQKLALPIL